MITKHDRRAARDRRHRRVRLRVRGTEQRPRLVVFRSLNHMHVQLINDDAGHTLAAASTTDLELRDTIKGKPGVEAATVVGEAIASRAHQLGVTAVVFDRGGYRYHGRIKALAEAARSRLEF